MVPLLDLVLPRIECEASAQDYGRFVMGPMESGYGVTIGNALRRVLLSSLPGAAVTSLRVGGVSHEFSEIPSAKEDMTALILHVKQLRLRMYSDGEALLRLNVRGVTDVTGGDILCPAEVEIVNPELHILTLDSSDAELEIELICERGRGYSPAEEREKLPIGQIPIDAIFSPIRKVNMTVERMRVGQMTDFDRLVAEVWADGTVAPAAALKQSAQILIEQLTPAVEFGEEVPEEEPEVEERGEVPDDVYETPIEDLNLTVRAYNCLKRAGIRRVGEVLDRLRGGDAEMLSIRNFGQMSLVELKEKLGAKGWYPVEGDSDLE